MNVEKLIQEGKNLLDTGNVAEAILKWQQALIYEPENTAARNFMQQARALQESSGPADRTINIGSFTKWLQDSDASRREIEDKFKEALLLLSKGQTADAIPILETVSDLAPERFDVKEVLERAKAQFKKEEHIDEDYEEGMRFLQQGYYMEAIAKFLQILSVDEKNAMALEALDSAKHGLEVALASGASVQAAPSSESFGSIDFAPEEDLVQAQAKEIFKKGVAAYKAGNIQEAVVLWERVIKLDPSHPKAAKYIEKALGTPTETKSAIPLEPPVSPPKPSSSTFKKPSAQQKEEVSFEIPASSPPVMDFATQIGPPSFDFSAAPQEQAASVDFPTQIGEPPEFLKSGFSFDAPPAPPPSKSFSAGNSFANAASDSGFKFETASQKQPETPKHAFSLEPADLGKQQKTQSSVFSGSFSFDSPPPKESLSKESPSKEPSFSFEGPSYSTAKSADPFAQGGFGDSSFSFGLETSVSEKETEEPAAQDVGISFSAADFLGEVKAYSANSKEPPPAWIQGDAPPIPAKPAQPQTPDELFEEAKNSMRNLLYNEAVAHLTKALELKPKAKEIQDLLKKAQSCIDSKIQISNELSQAELAYISDDWKTASKHAQKVLEFNPFMQRAEQIARESKEQLASVPQHSPPSGSEQRTLMPAEKIINPFSAPRAAVRFQSTQAKSRSSSKLIPMLFVLFVLLAAGFFYWKQENDRLLEEQEVQKRALAKEAEQKRQAEEFSSKAKDALSKGDVLQARDLLRQAVQLQPHQVALASKLNEIQLQLDQMVQPHLEEAQAYLDRCDYENAIFKVKQALALDPKHTKATSLLAQSEQYAVLKLKDAPEEKIFRLSNFQKFVEQGDKFYANRNYQQAKEVYEIAYTLNPKNDQVPEKIARATEKAAELREIQEKMPAFVKDVEKLISTGNLTNALEKVNKLLEAVPESEEALRLKNKIFIEIDRKKNITVYKKQAMQYYQMNNNEMALEYFKKWLEVEPDSKDAKFYVKHLSKNTSGSNP